MIDGLLSRLAPHLCQSCGEIGTLLCDSCKYDIVSEVFNVCVSCAKPAGNIGICGECRPGYSQAWCVGERGGVLQRLIGLYKFQNAKAAHQPLGDLLCERLPVLPSSTVIVPVPTVASHIRQRGYDHTLLMARYVAKKQGLTCRSILDRATNTMQRHADYAKRKAQAKAAFRSANGQLDPQVPYLLLDDVITTGATLRYAAKTLRQAGAETIWVAALARQTLD